MDLNEAIKHCEEVAEENEKISLYTPVEFIPADLSIEQCQNCAAEHRQLAEWLKKLQKIEQIITDYGEHKDDFVLNYLYEKLLEVIEE